MRNRTKRIIGPALAACLGLLMTAHASATPDGVGCGSVDNRFTRCHTGWDDARLEQQLSRSACIRGNTWGMERGDIWVDRGCRGSFTRLGGSQRASRYDGDQAGDYDEIGRLVEALHDKRRDQRDRRRGTDRGDDRSTGPWIPGAPYRSVERTIECSSYNKDYSSCPIGTRNLSVRLVETLSDAPCKEGRSWGWTDNAVWVNRGCRGLFAVDEGRR